MNIIILFIEILNILSTNLTLIVGTLTPVVSGIVVYFVNKATDKQKLKNLTSEGKKVDAETDLLESEKWSIDIKSLEEVTNFWKKQYNELRAEFEDLSLRLNNLENIKNENENIKAENGKLREEVKVVKQDFEKYKELAVDLIRAFNYLTEVVSKTHESDVLKAKEMIKKYGWFLDQVKNNGS